MEAWGYMKAWGAHGSLGALEGLSAHGILRGKWELGGTGKLVGHLRDDFDNVRMS